MIKLDAAAVQLIILRHFHLALTACCSANGVLAQIIIIIIIFLNKSLFNNQGMQNIHIWQNKTDRAKKQHVGQVINTSIKGELSISLWTV